MPRKLSAEELVNSLNIDVKKLYETYLSNGKNYTAKLYNLSSWKLVERILKYYGYDISNRDSKKINTEKTEKSLFEKYGVKHALQNKDIKNKLINTNLKKFGTNYYMGTEEFKNKSINTNLKKYGYEWSTQNPEIKLKHSNSNYLKYGVKDYKQRNASTKLKVFLNDLDKSIEFLSNNSFTFNDLKDYFNEDQESQLYSWLNRFDLYHYLKHSAKSGPEDELAEFLYPYGFTIRNNRTLLDNKKEIDIYNPKLKIGVEFNGVYFHSSICLEDKNYHLKKSINASEKGIRLIHIYENEWKDPNIRPKIESLLKIACGKVPDKIYARKCKIKEITNQQARDFNNKNHLQGHRNAQVTFGLFYEDKLVQLMSFSKTKYNRNLKSENDWEIIRGCPGSNNIVIGGVGKLFSHFIKTYNPDRVFSYCDFNKFDGRSYEAIGMKFIGYTGPNKWWVIRGNLVNRNPKKYHELKNSAEAIVWGSGSKKYLWEKSTLK